MAFSILDRLKNSNFASKTALTCGEESLTFGELDRLSSLIALRLKSSDLKHPQPTIGLFAPSSLEYVVGLIGIWKAGGIAVPLQPAHPASELAYVIDDAELAAVLVHPRCGDQASELVAGRKCELVEIKGEAANQAMCAGNHAAAECEANTGDRVTITGRHSSTLVVPHLDDGALLIYTSGTTRKPKGVLTSHGGLEAQMRSLLTAWRWTAEDRTINVLPLHHVHGVVNVLCCSLAIGARCEMLAKFDPAVVWNRIATGDITVFMAVPTIYARLLEHWREQNAEVRAFWRDRARVLRLMVSGSAALPAPLFEAWENATGHRLLERYGMTEIGMALSNRYEGPRVPGRVGFPLPGVEVRLVDENGELIEGAGPTGEIEVRGLTVFLGYWRLPEITRESFTSDGWFKTGDVAERDETGSYRIFGRRSQDIIKSGGYKISALEIEAVLLENAAIAEVAVVGVDDPQWGERVAAAYVARAPIDESECVEFLRSKLARYKVPTLWRRVDSLPRNAMGKVLKPQVRAIFKVSSE